MLLFFSLIGGILLLDLVLSGDNALILGAIASKLPRRQRVLAIAFGGGLAIVLRITFTIIASLLLSLPLLQFAGALAILWIACKLLIQRHNQNEEIKNVRSESLFSLILTITLADLSMSLDNMLAVGALADGNIGVIIFGLLLSILILMLASALIAELIRFLPWLLDLAALLLAGTAANMILQDKWIGSFLTSLIPASFTLPGLGTFPWAALFVACLLIGGMLLNDIWLYTRKATKNA